MSHGVQGAAFSLVRLAQLELSDATAESFEIPTALSGRVIVKLRQRHSPPPEQSFWNAWPSGLRPVFTADPQEYSQRYAVLATIQLEEPLALDADRCVETPPRARLECEMAIERASNVLAVLKRRSTKIIGAFPSVCFIPHSDAARSFLDNSNGLRTELPTHIQYDPLPSLVDQSGQLREDFAYLVSRIDGIAILVDAQSHIQEVGKYRELVRFFERAFGASCLQLHSSLGRFLVGTSLDFTLSEVTNWFCIRDDLIHGLSPAPLLLSTPMVSSSVRRMEQAAFDVLYNKRHWRSLDAGRQQSLDVDNVTLNAMTMRVNASGLTFDVRDEHGVYSMVGAGEPIELPDGAWFRPHRQPEPTFRLESALVMKVFKQLNELRTGSTHDP